MCNAWQHPFGCDCGFGPAIAGYRVSDLIKAVGRAVATAITNELSPPFWEKKGREIRDCANKVQQDYKKRGIKYGYTWDIGVDVPKEYGKGDNKEKLQKWAAGLGKGKNIKVSLQKDKSGNLVEKIIISGSKRDVTDKDLEPLLAVLKDLGKESVWTKGFSKTVDSIKEKSKIRVCNEYVLDVLKTAGIYTGDITNTESFNSSKLFIEVAKPLPGDIVMVGGYHKNSKGKLVWAGHTGVYLETKGDDMMVSHIGRKTGPSTIEWSKIEADKTYKDFKSVFYRPILGSKTFRDYYDKLVGGSSKPAADSKKKPPPSRSKKAAKGRLKPSTP